MIEGLFHILVSVGSEWVLVLLCSLSIVIIGIAIDRARILSHYDRRGKSFWNQFTLEWMKNGVPSNWADSMDKVPDSAELKLINLLRKHPNSTSEEKIHLSDALVQSQKHEFDKR